MSGNAQHREIDTQPLVSALNLILQQYASKRGVRVGKNKYFFPSSSDHHPLSLGVEAYRGFFMSIRPMYKQLMVNINVCMTAFYLPGNLGEAMLAFLRQSRGGMPHAFADKLKVSTKHLGFTRKYTIHRIMTNTTARKEKFNCAELGGMVTVEDFFKRSTFIHFVTDICTDIDVRYRVPHHSPSRTGPPTYQRERQQGQACLSACRDL